MTREAAINRMILKIKFALVRPISFRVANKCPFCLCSGKACKRCLLIELRTKQDSNYHSYCITIINKVTKNIATHEGCNSKFEKKILLDKNCPKCVKIINTWVKKLNKLKDVKN